MGLEFYLPLSVFPNDDGGGVASVTRVGSTKRLIVYTIGYLRSTYIGKAPGFASTDYFGFPFGMTDGWRCFP